MSKKNVLIFPCGSEVAFEIHQALKYNFNFRVFGASSVEDHGRFVFKNYIGGVPFIIEADFISVFNKIIEQNKIDLVFPTHDTVSLFLSENRNKFKAKIAVPDYETANICRNKNLTYDLFSKYDFNPEIYHWGSNKIDYPVFLKPIIGEGSKNTRKINNENELNCLHIEKEDYLLVEFLPGEELTIDCFTNRNGDLKFIGPRQRNRVFGGISVNSSRVPLIGEIESIARSINNILKLRGLWFFQVKKDVNGKFKLLEVSVRTSSTMSLFRMLGVNFHLLTAYDLLDIDVEMIMNDHEIEIDRAFINRYALSISYDSVYIDFDDTITRNGEVNEFIMLFVYQQLRKKRKLILITRHEFDIYETLKKLKIEQSIFNKIITLNNDQSKAEAIGPQENCIFIDNAYKERKEVKSKLNIPVYDVDAIQSLIDWKE